MAIRIYVNGKEEKLEENTSISAVLEAKKIRPEVVSIELNDKIIPRDNYGTTVLKPEDRLELVYYMGGGTNCGFCDSDTTVSSPKAGYCMNHCCELGG